MIDIESLHNVLLCLILNKDSRVKNRNISCNNLSYIWRFSKIYNLTLKKIILIQFMTSSIYIGIAINTNFGLSFAIICTLYLTKDIFCNS